MMTGFDPTQDGGSQPSDLLRRLAQMLRDTAFRGKKGSQVGLADVLDRMKGASPGGTGSGAGGSGAIIGGNPGGGGGYLVTGETPPGPP